MRYEIGVHFNSRSAKNKATVYGPANERHDKIIILDARNDDDAWMQAVQQIAPGDKRPVSGRSYIRQARVNVEAGDGTRLAADYKVGQAVRLHTPYVGFSGNEKGFATGRISEVLSPTTYSIALDGYFNPYVDFSTREFVVVGVQRGGARRI